MHLVEINGDYFKIQSMQRMEIFSIRKKAYEYRPVYEPRLQSGTSAIEYKFSAQPPYTVRSSKPDPVSLHVDTVHVDNTEYFICPTTAHTNYFKIVKLLRTFKITILAYAATAPKTSLTTCVTEISTVTLAKHRVLSSLMMVYVNRNMMEQVL